MMAMHRETEKSGTPEVVLSRADFWVTRLDNELWVAVLLRS